MLDALGLRVNMYSFFVENSKGEVKLLRFTATNTRENRRRPESNLKDAPIIINSAVTDKKTISEALAVKDEEKQAFAK